MHRVAFALFALAACSGGSSGDSDAAAGGDASRPADAADLPRTDAGPGSCLEQVPDDWGKVVPLDTSQWSSEGDYTYYADLVPDTERFQRLFIGLNAEMGVFSGPVVPGTFVLEGDENDYAWCGACVYLAVDDDGSAPSILYMAQSGKLTIDSVGAEIHGELSGAELVQIEIVYSGPSCEDVEPWPCGNSGCSGGLCGVQDVEPDCITRVDSLSF